MPTGSRSAGGLFQLAISCATAAMVAGTAWRGWRSQALHDFSFAAQDDAFDLGARLDRCPP